MSMIFAGTGHRPNKLGGYGEDVTLRLIALATAALRQYQPVMVISGMALGWDQALAMAALELKIPFHAYVPCLGQDRMWPADSRAHYKALIAQAAHIDQAQVAYSAGAMQMRNVAMVDACTHVLALWDGSTGGTGNCIKYANGVRKPIINVWPEWVKGQV